MPSTRKEPSASAAITSSNSSLKRKEPARVSSRVIAVAIGTRISPLRCNPRSTTVPPRRVAEIAAEFERRLGNDADAEFATALAQIDRIAALRLAEILP